MDESLAAVIFTVLTELVFIFQGCLALGLPWGKASMGGKYPGEYPPKMKIVAIINMVILGSFYCNCIVKIRLTLSAIKTYFKCWNLVCRCIYVYCNSFEYNYSK